MDNKLFSGKYEVQGEIARGGMGIIYRALHTNLNRPVAIKLLHAQFTGDPSFLKRFQREARAMARMDHENIIRVFDVSADTEGSQYIVMEFFGGTDLKRLILEKGKLAPRQALSIAIQVAEALAYAHSQGIIHRDIKPGNIMVDSRGRVKIADFGIAAASDEISVTATGQIIGTPEYMSPEQARGEHLDGRSDLYSLGMVIYEMVIGQTPFEGISRMAIVGKLLYEKEELALQFPQEVPFELQDLVRRLLRKEAKERISAAGLLVQKLKEIKEEISGGPEPLPDVEEEDGATVLLPQSRPAPAARSPVKAPSSSPKPVKAPGLVKPPPAQKPKVPERGPGRFSGWLTAVAGAVGVIVLVAGVVYALFLFIDRQKTPSVAEQKTEQKAAAPALSLNEIRDIQSKIREIQDQIIKSRTEADNANARRWVPEMYQSALDFENKGTIALQEGGNLINQNRYNEAVTFLQEANNSFGQANDSFNRAKDGAIAKSAKEEKTREDKKKAEKEKLEAKKKAEARKKEREAVKKPEPKKEVTQVAKAVSPPVLKQDIPPSPREQPAKPDIEVVGNILSRFKTAYENKDMAVLQQMSEMSDGRARFLRGIFKEYTSIKISVTNFSLTGNTASAQVIINKLSTPDGGNVIPGPDWKQAKVVIRKENGTWGKVTW